MILTILNLLLCSKTLFDMRFCLKIKNNFFQQHTHIWFFYFTFVLDGLLKYFSL